MVQDGGRKAIERVVRRADEVTESCYGTLWGTVLLFVVGRVRERCKFGVKW